MRHFDKEKFMGEYSMQWCDKVKQIVSDALELLSGLQQMERLLIASDDELSNS